MENIGDIIATIIITTLIGYALYVSYVGWIITQNENKLLKLTEMLRELRLRKNPQQEMQDLRALCEQKFDAIADNPKKKHSIDTITLSYNNLIK